MTTLTHTDSERKGLASSTSLLEYAFDGHPIRVVLDDEGDPLFVAADVCKALGIKNPSDAISRLDDDEKGLVSNETPGGTQQMIALTEPGLYNLVMGSRKPQAKPFQRWVTHEVLPAIRRTGRYERAPRNDETWKLLQQRRLTLRDRVKYGQRLAEIARRNGADTFGDHVETMVLAEAIGIDPIEARLPAKAGNFESTDTTAERLWGSATYGGLVGKIQGYLGVRNESAVEAGLVDKRETYVKMRKNGVEVDKPSTTYHSGPEVIDAITAVKATYDAKKAARHHVTYESAAQEYLESVGGQIGAGEAVPS